MDGVKPPQEFSGRDDYEVDGLGPARKTDTPTRLVVRSSVSFWPNEGDTRKTHSLTAGCQLVTYLYCSDFSLSSQTFRISGCCGNFVQPMDGRGVTGLRGVRGGW